jgi:predicted nuclease with RNAse H fold
MVVIGLDAASSLSKFGYAIGRYDAGCVQIEHAGLIESRDHENAIDAYIAPALRGADQALVAIDAPLGWPATLAAELRRHRAGEAFSTEKDALFQRQTDLFVHKCLGKKPLEIGADRIARAAHRALDVLQHLRRASGKSIPLAWSTQLSGVAAIEIYPAGTLIARDLPHSGYKKKEQGDVRHAIANALAVELPDLKHYADGNADVFDACLCLVAAKDFVDGFAVPPDDLDSAYSEGWIWVRRSASNSSASE